MQRMLNGELFNPWNEEIAHLQAQCLEMLYDYNMTRPSEPEKRQALLKQMFGKIGTGCYLEPPFHANRGGKHVFMGNNVYANFNLTLVDDDNIFIGDNCVIGTGSVVTKDIPANTVAVGNPCRVLREIGSMTKYTTSKTKKSIYKNIYIRSAVLNVVLDWRLIFL